MARKKTIDESLGGGVVTAETWPTLARCTTDALEHMIAQGEVPEFTGEPMRADAAVAFLRAWLEEHQGTLIEGGADFLGALVRKFAAGEADLPIDEFEAALVGLTDEQLTVLSEMGAEEIGAKAAVVDARRALVAHAIDAGKVLLRGSLASGLAAVLAPEPSPAAAAQAPQDAPGATNAETAGAEGPGATAAAGDASAPDEAAAPAPDAAGDADPASGG